MQQEMYQIFHLLKAIINVLGQIYQDKKNTSIPQHIDFEGELEEDDVATMFFIAEKQVKTILNFSLNLSVVSK